MKNKVHKKSKNIYQIFGINGFLNVINNNNIKISHIDLMQGGYAARKKDIINNINKKSISINRLPKEQFLKKYLGKRTQGIVVRFIGNFIKDFNLYQKSKNNECLLVVDNLEDPQNLGQIIRTAECANIKGLLVPEHGSVQVTDSVLQVSQGAFVHLPIYKCGNLHRELVRLKKENFWIIGVENSIQAKQWHEIDYRRNMVLVLGSEGKGIRPLIIKTCDELITIPMHGSINSLNVSSAASIVLFERQRQLSI